MQFYFAALTGKTDFTCSYDVLQLPFGDAESSFGINLGTTTVINFAHAHDLAIQYWTVNAEEDMALSRQRRRGRADHGLPGSGGAGPAYAINTLAHRRYLHQRMSAAVYRAVFCERRRNCRLPINCPSIKSPDTARV